MAERTELDQLAINTIRTLAMDAVEAAKSGHPGTPMALAPVAYTLWTDVLRFDPAHPRWPNRDRFVLSAGHASMLLYASLHLADVQRVDEAGEPLGKPAISLDDIRNFRQLESPAAGHPEHELAPGIETTTGPLGQGVGNSVGMAIASQWLARHFNRPGYELFDFRVWAVCSDGDLMEGVGSEAASLAGHLQLPHLCWIFDNNRITIEGSTELAFSEDVAARFAGYGWRVDHVKDANDLTQLQVAFDKLAGGEGPLLIIVDSEIGWGSPNKQGSHKAHGAALGAEEVALTKEVYGWPAEPPFLVPDEVRRRYAETIGRRGQDLYASWQELFAAYARKHPELAEQWRQIAAGELPAGWDAEIPKFEPSEKGLATRVSSGDVLRGVAKRVPWLMGGSADLAPSTMTLLDDEDDFSAENYGGRNMHFGVREHGMAAALNGMALCGLRPYGATFLVFSDYARPSMRLAALMGLPAIYVYTHDSVGVGEDGPTHQPVEHLAALRAMPGLITIRPGDANEAAQCWRAIMPINDRPVAFVLSRQGAPTLDRTQFQSAAGAARGAYVLIDPPQGPPQVILIGTGTEVSIALAAQQQLADQGIAARAVSMPSWELFEAQDENYRREILPPEITARVAVEAASGFGWDRYLGLTGVFIGMSGYGASAPAKALYQHFNITAERVAEEARRLVD